MLGTYSTGNSEEPPAFAAICSPNTDSKNSLVPIPGIMHYGQAHRPFLTQSTRMNNYPNAWTNLEEQARQANFRVSKLARKRGASPRHLNRLFKDKLGASPSKW